MIAKECDPAAMTAAERLAEIAAIMAAGYLRLRVARALPQKGLDVLGQGEAQCGSKAMNPKSEDHAA